MLRTDEYDNYRALCRAEQETDEANQDVLISYLHDLGTVLCFRDDHRLNHLGVLKPDWVTQGIYGLLNAEVLWKAGGILQASQLGSLLDGKRYPPERHGFLLQLMQKFELCFNLPGTNGQQFLIPELLPKETPDLAEWKISEVLRFEYHYNILPEGLLPRFIVRTHMLSEAQKRWRSGVVLCHDEALALIRADVQARVVTITIGGPELQQRDLLAIVREHFEEMHASIIGLEAKELVSLKRQRDAALIDYRLLQALNKNSIPYYFARGSGGDDLIKIDVQKALAEIAQLKSD